MGRIVKLREGTTWKEFREKFGKLFPISHEGKRLEAMGKEYTRLTGKPAEDEPVKKGRRQQSKSFRVEERNVKGKNQDNLGISQSDSE